jgi:hypothetical protein
MWLPNQLAEGVEPWQSIVDVLLDLMMVITILLGLLTAARYWWADSRVWPMIEEPLGLDGPAKRLFER